MDKWIIGALALSLFMAGVLALFASPLPDGLEQVAEDHGFLEAGEGHEAIQSPMPDYVIPGIENEALAGSLAGVFGTLLMFGFVLGIAKVLKEK